MLEMEELMITTGDRKQNNVCIYIYIYIYLLYNYTTLIGQMNSIHLNSYIDI